MYQVTFSAAAQDVVVRVSSAHPLARFPGFAIEDAEGDGSTMLLLGSALEALMLRVAHLAPELELYPLGSAMVDPGFLVDRFDTLSGALDTPLPEQREDLPLWLSLWPDTFEVTAANLHDTREFVPGP